MKAKLDAGRALLYQTARYVDIYKCLEDIERERKLTPEEKKELKKFSKLADSFTPLAKGMNSEYANQNSYDCIQIHGGSGFMLEYACQRLYRDARITSIYEGTTQLQTVAAIRYVTNGFYGEVINDLLAETEIAEQYAGLKERVVKMAEKYNAAVAKVVDLKDDEFKDFCSRHLYEMAADTVMGILILRNATQCPELFEKSAKVYVRYAAAEVEKHADFVADAQPADLDNYRK